MFTNLKHESRFRLVAVLLLLITTVFSLASSVCFYLHNKGEQFMENFVVARFGKCCRTCVDIKLMVIAVFCGILVKRYRGPSRELTDTITGCGP